MAQRELTGRHVFAITASAFAVIIAVNVFMAVQAVSTFPGLETKNSYVASQEFDAKRDAQLALGWQAEASYADGAVTLVFRDQDGRAVAPETVDVLIGRTTEARDDITPTFVLAGDAFRADADLARGKWMMRVQATAPDGTPFLQRLELIVRG